MRRLLVLGLLLPLVGSAPFTPAVAAECDVPSYRVVADAAPVAAQLLQGTKVYVPVAYAHVEHETTPRYVFAEAGSTALGALEGTELQPAQLITLVGGFSPIPIPPDLLPIPAIPGMPMLPDPPGRSVSGYPTESIAGERTATWGIGTSRAATGPDLGQARSDTAPGIGAMSRIDSSIACDVLTVEAEWSVRALELPGGVRLGQLGQRVRIVVRPEGEPEVDVDTIVLDSALEPLGIEALLDQVPDGPLQELLRAAGQDLDVASPVVTTTESSVHVTSAPVLVRVVRPDAPQGVEVHVGHLDVLAQRLPSPPPIADEPLASPLSPAALPPLPGTAASVSAPPPASPAGVTAVIDGQVIDEVRSFGSVPWRGVVAVLALALAWWRVADARRDRWPTAHWTLTHLERAARRFRAAYLRW